MAILILAHIILECLSHDLKNIGSQNPKLLTQVVHINPTLGLKASCWIDSTTFVSGFGFCDPIFFKSWDCLNLLFSIFLDFPILP